MILKIFRNNRLATYKEKQVWLNVQIVNNYKHRVLTPINDALSLETSDNP